MSELKTLKNIEFEEGFDNLKQISDAVPPTQQYGKLIEGYKGRAIFVSDLRAEAIKWIKEIRSKAYDTDEGKTTDAEMNERQGFPYSYEYSDEYGTYGITSNVVLWIKHFFNITDEDLE